MALRPPTILCLASYEKGSDFLRQAKLEGARVLLLTSLSIRDVDWPRESIDEMFFMPDVQKQWNRDDTLKAVCHLMKTETIDRIVPLDDFDLELAAFLREHTRTPGLGESQTRYFRDKLAMRGQAASYGIRVPEFTAVLHHGRLQEFLDRVPPPWVLKPRLMAGAIGIKKVNTAEELWHHVNRLGDEQSFYLVERFVPGDVFHVDSVLDQGQVRFAAASQYGKPPIDVSQGGGIFTTKIVRRGTELEASLLETNRQVMFAMGLWRGVSHTEFIRSHETGEIYFLETSARVGGANIADLVETATGLNPWKEWARLECLASSDAYWLPQVHEGYAGLLVSLARQEWPDLTQFNDPEVVWRMKRKNHVGLIVRADDPARVDELLDSYIPRVQSDYHAAMPPKERPTD